MVKCKIVSDIIILKIDVEKIGDVKYFEVDTGFHKFHLKNKTEGTDLLGFYTGYSFEFHEDAHILQQQLAKNPIKLTLSNDECKLAEGESYWPSYIFNAINGTPQESVHVVRCKLNSELVKFDVIELIIRLKVTPIKSIDIDQLHRISLKNGFQKKPNKPNRRSQTQIFQELAKEYQATLARKKLKNKFEPQVKSKNQQRLKNVVKDPRLKRKPRRLLGGCEIDTQKYNELCTDCKCRRLSGGLCSGSYKNLSSRVKQVLKAQTCRNVKYESTQRDAGHCAGKKDISNGWQSNRFPADSQKAHLSKLMNEMYEIFYLNQLREEKHNENMFYRKQEHLKNLKKQQFDDHQRKQRHLQRIYQLMKHPLLQNCMSHIGQRHAQVLRRAA